jgi:hypothetical protein
MIFKRKPQALSDQMRQAVYGASPLEQWPEGEASGSPWNAFAEARAQFLGGGHAEAVELWRAIINKPGLETRHYLQAWHFLKQAGEVPPSDVQGSVLGVVVEVALRQGVDLLAAYADHTVQYFNHSGSAVVWERPDTTLDASIDELIGAGRVVVAQIGPWEGPFPKAPARGEMRLSFLTPSGLYFGQGSESTLRREPLAVALIEAATHLLTQIVGLKER